MSHQNEPPLGVGGSGPVLFFIGMVVLFLVIQALSGCAMVSQQVQAPTPVGVAPWVAVGDSVTKTARPYLIETLPPGGVIHAEVASSPYSALLAHEGFVPLIDRVRANSGAQVLIIQDDARDQSAEQWAAFMTEVQSLTTGCIVWVTPWNAMSRPHDAIITSVIEANVSARERIAPWGASTEDEGLLTTDTVHLTPHGGRIYARLVADAVESC